MIVPVDALLSSLLFPNIFISFLIFILSSLSVQAWVGHPYYDVVDNSTNFENKIKRVIALICNRIGKQFGSQMDDRLQAQSQKRKFLIKTLPPLEVWFGLVSPVWQNTEWSYLMCFGCRTSPECKILMFSTTFFFQTILLFKYD